MSLKNAVTLKIVLLTGDESSPHHFTAQAKQAGLQFRTAETAIW
jgi:hypothetical protein